MCIYLHRYVYILKGECLHFYLSPMTNYDNDGNNDDHTDYYDDAFDDDNDDHTDDDDDAYDDVLHLGFYSAPSHLGPPNIFQPWPT